MSIKLNANGEVCDIVGATQFVPAKTEFACGFFTASMARYASKPGLGGTGSEDDIQAWAFAQYASEYGSNGANKVGGVSIDDMHRLLIAALDKSGISHYYDLPIHAGTTQTNDLSYIKASLASGYPVAMTIVESSVIDIALGNNPYFWGASGTHVVLCTGVDANGNLLIHDSANVVGPLQGDNVVRPMPRHYDSKTIDCTWASMCRVPWHLPFPDGWDAVKGPLLNQIQDTSGVEIMSDVIGNGPNKDKMICDIWDSCSYIVGKANIPPRDLGIFVSWRTDLINGIFRGLPLSHEWQDKDENGDDCALQTFTCGIAIWRIKDGLMRWV